MGNSKTDRRLFTAVRKGLVTEAEALMDVGGNVNACDRYGLALLLWAARKGHANMISSLVGHGADPGFTDRTGRTALHHAVLFGNADCVAPLALAGVPVDAKDMHGVTALDVAKGMDDFDSARELLDVGAKGEAPDPGDISIGIVVGDPGDTPLLLEIKAVQNQVAQARHPNPWCERGHLNVVFYVAGEYWCPDFEGIRPGRFSPKKRMFMVQVAVRDPSMTREAARVLVIEALRAAVEIAVKRFARAGVPFSAADVSPMLAAFT